MGWTVELRKAIALVFRYLHALQFWQGTTSAQLGNDPPPHCECIGFRVGRAFYSYCSILCYQKLQDVDTTV
jgi:hypothetical protein